MSNRLSSLIIWGVSILVILSLMVLTWTNYRFSQQNPGGNDFLARWMGARYWLVEGISPYDSRVSLATQNMIYGRPANTLQGEDVAHFVYPLPSMIFFGPFGLLDYLTARAIWMTVLELSLILLAVVSIKLADWSISPLKVVLILLFTLFWYHSVRTVMVGQFAAINALLIALALLLIQRKMDFTAGILLALSTSKPQMVFLLLPFVFIWAISVRRRELWMGILVGILILYGVTLLVMPDWPLQMLRQMMDYPNYTNIGSPLSIIADATPGIRDPMNVFLHLVFTMYLLVEWYLAWGKSERHFMWTTMLTLVITNIIAFRTATTNYVILIPVLFYIFKIMEEGWGVYGRWFIWFSLAVLGVGIWILFLRTVQGNVEQPIVYLPLPFFCLFGLWWVRWWAIRSPRLLSADFAKKYVE